MFSKQDILSALEPILDTSLLVEMGDHNYYIDTVNNFGFSLDSPEGITIYYCGEHFHLWKIPEDNTVSYEDILKRFLEYVKRLVGNRILFIYTYRGKTIVRIKIVEYDNDKSVIENYVTSINPLRLLLKKKVKREIIEFKQR
jgi:hypothetical protein